MLLRPVAPEPVLGVASGAVRSKAPIDLPKRLRAQRADSGPLVLVRMPSRVAYDGVEPRTVHPLLIYTELLAAGEPRAREAATEIWHRHLEYLQ